MLLLVFAAPASAQTRVEVQGILAATSGLGNTGHAVGAGVRSVSRFGRWGLDGRLTFLNAPKAQTRDGQAISGDALVRYYFGNLYAGGGFWLSRLRTSLYRKVDGGPVATFGWQRDLAGVEAAYRHGLNGNHQRIVRFSGDVPVVQRGRCYVLVGGEILSDSYFDPFQRTANHGARVEFRVSGGCRVP